MNTKAISSRLPKEIRIFSKVYKVKYIRKLENIDSINKKKSSPKADYEKEVIWGNIDFSKCEIRVYKNKEYPMSQTISILLHEIVHCIEHELSIDFNKDDPEKIVDNIAIGFYNLLIENDFNIKSIIK